ncbi:MAG: hypothetical protein NTX72_00350 [Candidatus Uhrbacteria bacterium]|nr:hypothetical protein [Candidatus Uhrbacteria bacterium]
MENEPYGNLTHLWRFHEVEESYQILLRTARKVIKERQFSGTFLAEDLYARDRLFGSVRSTGARPQKDVAPKWNELIRLFQQPWSQETEEAQTLLLIRGFLSHAVTRGDLRRAQLVGSQHDVRGFAFVEKTPSNST